MLLGYIYVIDNNASYTYQFLKEIIFQLLCTLPHIACNDCIETKEYLFAHGLLQTNGLATQILSKSLRSYSVFVSTAIKHFTRSDGINHRCNTKYKILWVCFCSLRYPACKSHAPYYIVVRGLSGCTTFSTLSHKRYGFPETLLNIHFFDFLYNSYLKHFSFWVELGEILS